MELQKRLCKWTGLPLHNRLHNNGISPNILWPPNPVNTSSRFPLYLSAFLFCQNLFNIFQFGCDRYEKLDSDVTFAHVRKIENSFLINGFTAFASLLPYEFYVTVKYLWLDSVGLRSVLCMCDFNEKIPFVESLVPHVLAGARVMNYAHLINTNRR